MTDADDQAEDADGPVDASISGRQISAKVQRLFELVPEIGTRWRWYDVPYRLLSWMLQGWRRRFVPWRVRLFLNRGVNFFMAFEHFDRTKVESLDDPMDNLLVPESERVRQGGLWVVELFPPSTYPSLDRDLRRNGWDTGHRVVLDGPLSEQVKKARAGRGFAWSRIATVARPDTRYMAFDAKREKLPDEFELIELSAVQLGTSITAIVAFVRLTEAGEQRLNEVWKATHEPVMEWHGLRRPHVLNRYFAAIRAGQRERRRLHDLARGWMSEHCHGYFAGAGSVHPVIDLDLFDEFDPLEDASSRALGEPLRALGMDEPGFYNYVSPQVPGAVFNPVRAPGSESERLGNCWGIVGRYERIVDENERSGYGDKPYEPATLAAMFDDEARAFLLHIAVMEYVTELTSGLARARDLARSKHGRFKARRVRELRRELLGTSLDLDSVARDSAELWDARWRRWNGIEVKCVAGPLAGDNPPEEFDYIEDLGRARSVAFEELLVDDAAYRTVLSTVASLGASADASRNGRLALAVAGVSLAVAVVTLLVTETGSSSLFSRVLEWFG